MQSHKQQIQPPNNYLHQVLVYGTRPFLYRGRVRSLLGFPEWTGGDVLYPPVLPPVGFRYVDYNYPFPFMGNPPTEKSFPGNIHAGNIHGSAFNFEGYARPGRGKMQGEKKKTQTQEAQEPHSNSHFDPYKKEILIGQARGPAPTKSKIHDNSEFQSIYGGTSPCGRPKIIQNEKCREPQTPQKQEKGIVNEKVELQGPEPGACPGIVKTIEIQDKGEYKQAVPESKKMAECGDGASTKFVPTKGFRADVGVNLVFTRNSGRGSTGFCLHPAEDKATETRMPQNTSQTGPAASPDLKTAGARVTEIQLPGSAGRSANKGKPQKPVITEERAIEKRLPDRIEKVPEPRTSGEVSQEGAAANKKQVVPINSPLENSGDKHKRREPIEVREIPGTSKKAAAAPYRFDRDGTYIPGKLQEPGVVKQRVIGDQLQREMDKSPDHTALSVPSVPSVLSVLSDIPVNVDAAGPKKSQKQKINPGPVHHDGPLLPGNRKNENTKTFLREEPDDKFASPSYRNAALRIEQLRQEVHRLNALNAKMSSPSSEAAKSENGNRERGNSELIKEDRAQHAAPPPRPPVIIRRSSGQPQKNQIPCAFWERSYLGRFHLRTLR